MTLLVLLTFTYILLIFILHRVAKLKFLSFSFILFFIFQFLYLGETTIPIKKDQLKYVKYGQQCIKDKDKSIYSSVNKTTNLLKEQSEYYFIYPVISCFVYRYTSMPLSILRLLNLNILLLIFLMAYQIIRNLFNDHFLARKTLIFISFLPSFYIFSLLVVRDLLISFSFGLGFLGATYIKKSERIKAFCLLGVSGSLLFGLRIHLLIPLLFICLYFVLIEFKVTARVRKYLFVKLEF